jgi:hypothetical protein
MCFIVSCIIFHKQLCFKHQNGTFRAHFSSQTKVGLDTGTFQCVLDPVSDPNLRKSYPERDP